MAVKATARMKGRMSAKNMSLVPISQRSPLSANGNACTGVVMLCGSHQPGSLRQPCPSSKIGRRSSMVQASGFGGKQPEGM